MRKKPFYLITTLGLLGFLTGLAITVKVEKRLPLMTDQTTPATALNRSGLSFRDGVGIGLVFTGAGLAVFGFHQMHKEKRSAKTHSITFDFSKGESEIQRLNESPDNTRHSHLNFYSEIKKQL